MNVAFKVKGHLHFGKWDGNISKDQICKVESNGPFGITCDVEYDELLVIGIGDY